ncbi:hypothetical protein [Longimicrobium sp.]|uniref:hypothetical protein n=1 Tax=Longimicrobium sp. TaxID=2029185 RepID=UPI002F94DA9F
MPIPDTGRRVKIAGAIAALAALAACQQPGADRRAAASRASDTRADMMPKPYEPALAAAIAATRPYEVPGRPCLVKVDSWPAITPDQRPRIREIQSDSHWLNRYVRERYGDRLAFTGLDGRGGRYRHVVALTGTERVPPLKLAGRAADVPVVITYDAPWSLREVERRREQAHGMLMRLVPDAQGVGFMESPDGGWILITVYSPGAQPRDDVMARCDALRRAYRLPVLIEFVAGRVTTAEVLAPPAEPAPPRPRSGHEPTHQR